MTNSDPRPALIGGLMVRPAVALRPGFIGTHSFWYLYVPELISIVGGVAGREEMRAVGPEEITRGAAIPGGEPGDAGGAGVSRVGRKRDRSRDADILDAALDLLAEVGFARLTIDMVAARARAGKGAIYRRWPSKTELIIDAVARMKHAQVDFERLPDTGALRDDLLSLFKPQSIDEEERKLKIMAGFASMLSHDQSFAEAGTAAIVEPWADAHRILMQRALNRGEIPATADIQTLSQVIPSMAAYRALIQRRPFDLDFLVSMVDGVVLPALRNAPWTSPPAAPDHTSEPTPTPGGVRHREERS